MATAGPKLTIPFIVGGSQIVGQGVESDLWCLYSTDDASETDPTWTDATADVRAFSTSRGRGSELSRVDPGTASITLNNRARTYDPVINTSIRPMNQWQIFERFSGETHSVFKGYAESYEQQWVKGAEEAAAVVACVDEFKVLALDKLPTTDPPRDTYQDLVMFDQPTGYWPMLVNEGVAAAVVGEPLTYAGSGGVWVTGGEGAIIGQTDGGYIWNSGTFYWQTPELTYAQSGDASGLSEFTIETWLDIAGTPASTELLIIGPDGIPSNTYTWKVSLNTSCQVVVEAKNASLTVHTCTGTSDLRPLGWTHIVATIDGGSLRLYINGVQEASTAWTGSFEGLDNAKHMIVGNAGVDIGAADRKFDEMAFYRTGLSAARVLAHYTAGRLRGFPRQQEPGVHISAALIAIGSLDPRTAIRTGTNDMVGTYMVGQSPLEEMRKAETAESVDAVLFISKEGLVTFLDDGHRAVSPWNTTQATFDDDGTDFPYQDIGLDFSDSLIANEWNVTKVGGLLQTASDATSIARYFKRTQALTDLPITTDADVTAIAAAMLAKYKDPMTRINRLDLLPHTTDLLDNIFRRDLGDRIRVFRTPPGGGARLDQQLFIQKIDVSMTPGQPWRVTLGLSPL